MDHQPTCGKGLAANSVVPATISDVISSLSAVLASHLKTLDLQDENSHREHAAYSDLAKAYGEIGHSLRGAAERMAGYRDLPMGRHDMQAVTASEPVEAFGRFVKAEQQLLALLHARLPDDQAMLADMKQALGANR